MRFTSTSAQRYIKESNNDNNKFHGIAQLSTWNRILFEREFDWLFGISFLRTTNTCKNLYTSIVVVRQSLYLGAVHKHVSANIRSLTSQIACSNKIKFERWSFLQLNLNEKKSELGVLLRNLHWHFVLIKFRWLNQF